MSSEPNSTFFRSSRLKAKVRVFVAIILRFDTHTGSSSFCVRRSIYG